jgi:hypothetical protein
MNGTPLAAVRCVLRSVTPFLTTLAVVTTFLASPAGAVYYLAGDFNGWNPSGSVMTDMGGGIWQASLANVGGRNEFKVTMGDWTNNWPGSGNSWFYGDGAGNVTLTFNANDVQDGWRGNWGRIGTNTDPGAWTAVGDWQGWNPGDPATAMVPTGGGVYRYQQTLSPGRYQWYAVVTGTWDRIGDDFRGINANSMWFEVTASNPTAVFQVNALSGAIGVDVLPEPATLAFLAAGAVAAGRMRRKPNRHRCF